MPKKKLSRLLRVGVGVLSLSLFTQSAKAGIATDALGLRDHVIILFPDNTTLRCDKEHALTACKILDEERISYTVENKDTISYLIVDVD